MNPKPFSALNHFTVPVATVVPLARNFFAEEPVERRPGPGWASAPTSRRAYLGIATQRTKRAERRSRTALDATLSARPRATDQFGLSSQRCSAYRFDLDVNEQSEPHDL